jgi:hypothetical protein
VVRGLLERGQQGQDLPVYAGRKRLGHGKRAVMSFGDNVMTANDGG